MNKFRLNISLFNITSYIVILFGLLSSCVNHLSNENNCYDEHDQITFNAFISSSATTRVVGNTFEKGDSVGVFALLNSAKMTDERYVDNAIFHYSSNGKFMSDMPTFYPDAEETLTFFSYYPFQKNGIELGNSKMNIAIKADQSLSTNYSYSDFLVAYSKNRSLIEKDIPLEYNHKLTKLNIQLEFKDSESIKNIKSKNIELFICGFCTKAEYDFTSDSFLNYTDIEKITPYGTWKVDKNKLIGKSAIFIPQPLAGKDQYLILKIDDKQYISYFPDEAILISGGAFNLNINYNPSEDCLISDINNYIQDWDKMDQGSTDSHLLHKYIMISDLSFEKSNIYNVIYDGNTVAKICKEYLLSDNISNQAIVAYLVKDGKTDLKNGVVLKLFGNSNINSNGGKVDWDIVKNKLNYIPGNKLPINRIYITFSKNITFDYSGDALPVWTNEDRLRDVRGKSVVYYPIVKIGTQFWMRENLNTSMYLDGNDIIKLEEVKNDRDGYLQPITDGPCFYNAKLALSNQLIPLGWKIPQNLDWAFLIGYLNNDAALLKSGEWKIMDNDKNKEIMKSNNMSYFNAYPVGICFGKIYFAYRNVLVLYWTLDDIGHGLSDQNIGFMSTEAKEIYASYNAQKALSIRCLKK